MDGGAWKAAVHGVAEGRTWLSDFTCTFHFHALEKEMATHSSVLAWRIPGTGEPGGLTSIGSHRVGHDWSDLAGSSSSIPYKNHKMVCIHLSPSKFCTLVFKHLTSEWWCIILSVAFKKKNLFQIAKFSLLSAVEISLLSFNLSSLERISRLIYIQLFRWWIFILFIMEDKRMSDSFQ